MNNDINKLIENVKQKGIFYTNAKLINDYISFINLDFLNEYYKNINSSLYNEHINIFNVIKNNFKNMNYFFRKLLENQEGYSLDIYIYKGDETKKIKNDLWLPFQGGIYLSGLLKYYILSIDNFNDDILKKKIIIFLQKHGYQELTKELGETELDIVGGEFMPYDAWVKKAKELYKESYIGDNFYYIDEMNWPKSDKERIEPNREEDFLEYCKKEYEGPYTVKHLLFGESFIGELS